jgi:type VI secretion system protein ImpA
VRSRDDALRLLDKVCDYLERQEPSNPAPLLIKRARRLMTMNFVDIIRDMAPDSLAQVETIAGIKQE